MSWLTLSAAPNPMRGGRSARREAELMVSER